MLEDAISLLERLLSEEYIDWSLDIAKEIYALTTAYRERQEKGMWNGRYPQPPKANLDALSERMYRFVVRIHAKLVNNAEILAEPVIAIAIFDEADEIIQQANTKS